MTMEEVTNNGDGVHSDLESIICRDDQSMKQFKLGDIVWIKTRNHCWWPGQVVVEDSVRSKPKKKVKDGVLIRMYGCYEYLYVDPVKCSTEFENMLKQENLSIREAFQRAVDEDLSRMRSGGSLKRKVSDSKDIATKAAPKGKKQKQDKMQIGEEVSPQHSLNLSRGASKVGETPEKKERPDKTKVGTPKGKNSKQEDAKEPEHTKTPRTTKYNTPQEPTSSLSERRVRVMQNLGLIAPQGSPYRRNGFAVTASLQ